MNDSHHLHSFASDDGNRMMKANISFIRFAMRIESDFMRNEMQTFCTVNDFFITSVLLPCVSDYSTFLLMGMHIAHAKCNHYFCPVAFPFIALFVCHLFFACSSHRYNPPNFSWTWLNGILFMIS